MRRHVMIDIETLSTCTNAVVLSVGACEFSLDGIGSEFYMLVQRDQQVKAGRHMDYNTVEWWMMQPHAARNALFGKPADGGELLAASPGQVMSQLDNFIRAVDSKNDSKPTLLWSHSPNFDLAILLSMAHDFNTAYRNPLSDFRSWRDTRTLYDLANLNLKDFHREGTAHHALDDAKFQALAAIEAMKRLSAKGA